MNKTKVALIGFAPSRDKVPWNVEDMEFWGCNEGYVKKFPKIDRWFQLHPFTTFSRATNHNDKNHYQWLQKKHDFPIYMQEKFPNIPASVRFPREECIALYGGYATSSFSYMMWLALKEGFTHIEVYGFEMKSDTEYIHQRPNAEYLIGLARGLGVNVVLPEDSNLLSGKIYGYDDTTIGVRQQLEVRDKHIDINKKQAEQKFFTAQGVAHYLENLIPRIQQGEQPNLNEEFNQWKIEAMKQSAMMNFLDGAKKELGMVFDLIDHVDGVKISEQEDNTEETYKTKIVDVTPHIPNELPDKPVPPKKPTRPPKTKVLQERKEIEERKSNVQKNQ